MRRDRRAGAPTETVTCPVAEPWIPVLAGDDDLAGVPATVTAHAATCLRCQADVAHYRRLVRDLRGLRGERLVPPQDGLAATLDALHHQPGRRQAAYLGIGGAVATAAGAAAGVGVLVWRSRRRTLAV